MRIFFHPDQNLHEPAVELYNGAFVPYAEHGGRVASVLAALGAAEHPADFGIAPIAAVHSAGYLDFLQSGHARWLAAGREGDAIPYVWPVRRRRALRLERVDALLGRYSFDATTPLTPTTWPAAYAAAQTALGATQVVLEGAPHAFALCRPPGHHAGADYMGGYCYLNSAAIAAQRARDAGRERIAVLDIDYHHGNGTQDIFWERGDVFFASIHADPATDYPFFWGHADETGAGEGEGATLNLPLAHGADLAGYRAALDVALARIAAFAPELLVVSFGADTFAEDPICNFGLLTGDYARIAQDIAACGWRTVIVLEGGYAVDQLGANVAALLDGFA